VRVKLAPEEHAQRVGDCRQADRLLREDPVRLTKAALLLSCCTCVWPVTALVWPPARPSAKARDLPEQLQLLLGACMVDN